MRIPFIIPFRSPPLWILTPRWWTAAAFGVALISPCLLSPRSAAAQAWRSDVQHAEGPGFRVGNLEIHPGAGVEGGYDSNVYYSEANRVDSFLLRVTPHLDLSTLSLKRMAEAQPDREGQQTLPKVAFRAGLSGSFYHFFSVKENDNMDANADLRLILFPKRRFSGSLFETFTRSIRPFTEQGAEGGNYARNANAAGGVFEMSSPGGVVRGSVGYSFLLDFFESASFEYLNNFISRLEGDATWRFLPSTSLVYDVDVDIQSFRDPNAAAALVLNDDTRRLRSRLGLNGAITSEFSAIGMVGYGGSFVSSDALSEYDDVVGQVEFRWRPRSSSTLAVGYDRDYFSSYLGSYYRRDRGYARYDQTFFGTLHLGAEFWGGRLNYGRIVDINNAPLTDDGSTSRDDTMISATLFAEYRLFDWLAVNGTFIYLGDFTDFSYQPGAALAPDPAKYQKLQGWLGVRAFY